MELPSAPTQIAGNAQSPGETETRLGGRWLALARVALLAISALALVVYIAGIPANLAWFHSFHSDCQDVCMTPATLQSLHTLGIPITAFAVYWTSVNLLFALSYFVVAALIFWRKSDDRMALLASFALVTLGAAFPSIPTALVDVHPAWQVPVAIIGNEDLFGFPSLILFFFLFPNGRFVPRWTRWVAIVFVAAFVLAGIFPGSPFSFPNLPGLLIGLIPLVIFGSLVFAQVYRYRHVSTAVERQQTKWIVFGMAIALLGFLLLGYFLPAFLTLFIPFRSLGLLPTGIAVTSIYLVLLLIPLSIAIAILRYRLWDIDIIINRTLVYGLLSACIVGIYVLVVGLLGALFQASGNLLISLVATGLVAVLFQPLRERLQRIVNRLTYGERDDPYRIISRLGEHLEATLTPDAILPAVAETVAHTLKLPYVAIELKEEEAFRQVSAFGTPVEPSLRIPLRYQQETVGQMLLASRTPGESFSSTDRRLLDDLARQAGIAANAVRLSDDLQRSRERLLLAREEERRRLARELHDSVSQALYGISLGAHAARTALDRDPQGVAEPLDYILMLADAALAEMRALIFELRPESLETEGLVSALSKQTAALQARHSIAVATELCDEPDLPLPVKEDLYRIAQEAMHNTVKHAHASHVDLRLDQTAGGVTLEVQDDGAGFDPTASFPGHLGLQSMRERIMGLGGTFQIESTPGAGTRVSVSIPGSK
jgi:signal transduction histidine kinase